MKKLSVVLATRNEEANIGRCLESVKSIANEIIVVDEDSSDKTREIAKNLGAKIYLEPHHDNFHITKQKALEKAKGDWILQLDADEVVTPELAREINEVLVGTHVPVINNLFKRHQEIIEKRDGKIGKMTGEIVAYFVPRRNIFLGKSLTHAGLYPDSAIRLFQNSKAHFPAKSVHEIVQIDGEVSWLSNDMLHYDSPTLKRYLSRLNRYTNLQAADLKYKKIPKNMFYFFLYLIYKPIFTFCNLYFRHLGFLDRARGFLWSFFSATHYPVAYFKYLTNREGQK